MVAVLCNILSETKFKTLKDSRARFSYVNTISGRCGQGLSGNNSSDLINVYNMKQPLSSVIRKKKSYFLPTPLIFAAPSSPKREA